MHQQGAASTSTAVAGEWAFMASVLGCERALSGHIFLDPNGQAAYVADGEQVVGRGVGRWVGDASGEAVAFELDVYQYAAATASVPEFPHRFRGVFQTTGNGRAIAGDWYFCPAAGEDFRLVGGFNAGRNRTELFRTAFSSSSFGSSSSPCLDGSLSNALMLALDSQACPWPPVNGVSPRMEPYTLSGVDSVQYIPDFINEEQEREFMSFSDLDQRVWEDMRTRSTQEWGAGDRCSCGRGLTRAPLPPWQAEIARVLHHLEVFDSALFPMNSVRINAYRPGQGIFPHCDGAVYYPKVAILSLGSPCIFSFYPRSGTEDCMQWDRDNDVPGGHDRSSEPLMSVYLQPRSLLVFGQDAFWHHRHGIAAVARDTVTDKVVNADMGGLQVGDSVDRTRRISLTMRHLLPRCACQG